jgi:hypothetical protein
VNHRRECAFCGKEGHTMIACPGRAWPKLGPAWNTYCAAYHAITHALAPIPPVRRRALLVAALERAQVEHPGPEGKPPDGPAGRGARREIRLDVEQMAGELAAVMEETDPATRLH